MALDRFTLTFGNGDTVASRNAIGVEGTAMDRENDILTEDEFFNRVKSIREQRENDLALVQELNKSIKKSELVIKAAAEERLKNAQHQGSEKLKEALCTQFILGGIEGRGGGYSIEFVPGMFPRTILKVSVYPLALRVEENPAFPVFMIAKGGNLNEYDLAFCKTLESHLKRLVKPYMWVSQSIIESYLRG